MTDSKTEIAWGDSGGGKTQLFFLITPPILTLILTLLGGFSAIFQAPAYQKEAVAAYLAKSGLPDKKLYNITGRVSM